MSTQKTLTLKDLAADFPAGVVTFLVALPLCLGIALASGAPLFSGILAGIIGGIVIGVISGSPTSVSGPAAGLAAIVVTQIDKLGGFDKFLLAVFLAGVLQVGLGIARAGFLAAFFPTSVIKGLLAAIGVLLILKQIPHLLGHDPDPVGEFAFEQPDHENTFSDLWVTLSDLHPAAIVIGLLSVATLVLWDKFPALKKLKVPGPLVVVILAVGTHEFLSGLMPQWHLTEDHLVQVPILKDLNDIGSAITLPDFTQFSNPQIYLAAVTLAIVASLETLLNLDAADTIDPKQRHSPPNRELFAQGVGNILGGLIGALPTTSVIVRSSVNVQSGNASKLSTIIHGVLLLLCVLLVPGLINLIPLSCLAAILIVTGFKLANPKLVKEMWSGGPAQFYPFAATVVAIVLTDLLIGILLGLATAIGFILHSNFRRPVHRIVEKHVTGDVIRIELREQVSFLNRAALEKTLEDFPSGSRVVLDATRSDFIDPDVLQLISDFVDKKAPVRDIKVNLLGFKNKYTQLKADDRFIDYSTRELQEQLTPERVLTLLREGNHRFIHGQRLQRDWSRQIAETAKGQAPLAVVLACIDSRNSSELIFDLGIGDIFSVRIAGNVAKEKVLGSIEYSCAVAGAKLIVVMGHTSCGAVTTAVGTYGHPEAVVESTGCEHINVLLNEIQKSVDPADPIPSQKDDPAAFTKYVDGVAFRHVQRTIDHILKTSHAIRNLVEQGKVGIIGALYDVQSGHVSFSLAEGPLAEALNERVTTSLPAPSVDVPASQVHVPAAGGHTHPGHEGAD